MIKTTIARQFLVVCDAFKTSRAVNFFSNWLSASYEGISTCLDDEMTIQTDVCREFMGQ